MPGHLPPPSDVLRQIDSGLLTALNFNRTELAAFGTAVTQVGADPARSRIGSVLMGPLLNHMHHRGDFPLDTRVFGAMVPGRDHREVPAGVKVDAVLPSEITEALAQDYSIPEFGLVRGTLPRLPGARGDSHGVRFVIVTVIDGKRTVFRGRVLKVDGCTIEYITESGEIRVTNTNSWEERRGATVIALRNY